MVSEGDHHGTFAYADDIRPGDMLPTELQKSIDIWCKVLTISGLKLTAAKSEVIWGLRGSQKSYTLMQVAKN
jgi:hypothetical protein